MFYVAAVSLGVLAPAVPLFHVFSGDNVDCKKCEAVFVLCQCLAQWYHFHAFVIHTNYNIVVEAKESRFPKSLAALYESEFQRCQQVMLISVRAAVS